MKAAPISRPGKLLKRDAIFNGTPKGRVDGVAISGRADTIHNYQHQPYGLCGTEVLRNLQKKS